MSLLKTSALNGIGLTVRMLGSLLSNKCIALMAGPGGVAVYGQFQSLLTLTAGLAAAPGGSGVVRLTASSTGDTDRMHGEWSAGMRAVLGSGIAVGLLGLLLSPALAAVLLQARALSLPLAIFFLCLPATAVMTLLLSCANGLADIRSYVLSGMVASLLSSLMVVVGVLLLGVRGAITAAGLGQLVSLLVVYIWLRRQPWFSPSHFRAPVSPDAVRQVFSLASMTVVAVICAPLVQLSVRELMAMLSGWTAVGYWQAVSRLGEMYMTVVGSLLGVYYLPRFSAIRAREELRREMRTFMLVVYPLFALGYLLVVLMREPVMVLVYSSSFLPAAKLLPLQMLADMARMLSWLVGFLVMARGSPIVFAVIELVVSAALVGLSYVFMRAYGYTGAFYASFLINVAYTIIFSVYLIKWRHI